MWSVETLELLDRCGLGVSWLDIWEAVHDQFRAIFVISHRLQHMTVVNPAKVFLLVVGSYRTYSQP